MVECPNCHKKNEPGTKFCSNCGYELNSNDTQNDTNESEKLKQEIDQLKSKLNTQKVEKDSVDIFEKIVPNRHNLSKVLAFSEHSSITIFAFFAFSVVLDSLRWWLLLILMLMLYFYPLLSGKTGFPWEEGTHKGINDSNGNSNLNRNINENIRPKPSHIVSNNDVKEPEFKASEKQPQTNTVATSSFKVNNELWSGIISLIIGLILYSIGNNNVQDMGSQIGSVFQNGSLNNGGYLYVIGLVLAEFGGLATIGGLVKGFSHNFTGGMIFKAIGVVVLIIAAGLGMYVYANPVDTAMNVVQSRTTMDDLQNILQVAKMIPWLAGFIYVIGIAFSAVKKVTKEQ